MSLRIRPVTDADLDAIAALHFAGNEDVALEEPLLPVGPPGDSVATFREQLEGELTLDDNHHLAAELDGVCVGWGHALVAFEPDGPRVGYVSALYVARGARRKGVGTALLDATVAWLKQQEVERIQLTAVSRAASRALWLKRGFRPFTETLVLAP